MKVLLLTQNYLPEEQNIYHHELTDGLAGKGHDVTALTAFPHYGRDRVYKGYRGRLFQRQVIDRVYVLRSWVYATASKSLLRRLLNFGSFCVSSLIVGLLAAKRRDIVYTSLPPLPLGVTGFILAKAMRAQLVLSIQDIFPRAAVKMGVLKEGRLVAFFEKMEAWLYQKAAHIVVISEGFRQHIISKGVSPEKISVVSNWADPDVISPGPKNNAFRKELNVGTRFIVIYSGGLTLNSSLEPVLYAADLLRNGHFAFVIVGDGARKVKLRELAAKLGLTNVQFKPLLPRELYPELLRAADMNLVTLHANASDVSLPSKVYKQMAVGRPILGICSPASDLARLIRTAGCGLVVSPDNPSEVAEALRWAAEHTTELEEMGLIGRQHLLQHHSREVCISSIDAVLRSIGARRKNGRTASQTPPRVSIA